MGARQTEMFAKPRQPRRVLMHVVDAGVAPSGKHIAHFKCRCGYDGDWWEIDSVSEAKRGLPCPQCNAEAP